MIRPEYEALALEIIATWDKPSDEDCDRAARILASARRSTTTSVTPLRPRVPAQRRAAA
ncbi:hypothetical protein [Micromonospora carbonacea]|uniref:hypothetical protein n=1 Tax=Micromonospora carbonacea TaxID=47853 RepID=UPI003712C4F2